VLAAQSLGKRRSVVLGITTDFAVMALSSYNTQKKRARTMTISSSNAVG
jgi:hypothetical protein